MDFLAKQIAPPKSSEVFEDLCLALFQADWQDSTAQKNGRAGQKQSGVDIFGHNYSRNGSLWGIECRLTDKLTRREVDFHLEQAETFKPALAHWILATTAGADVDLQEYARTLSAQRQANGLFPVTILDWSAIQSLLDGHRQVARRFYPEHFSDSVGLQASEFLSRARELSEKSLEIMRRVQGDNNLETLEAMKHLFKILIAQGNVLDAQALQGKMDAIRKKLARPQYDKNDDEDPIEHGFVFWRAGDENAPQGKFLALHRTWLKRLGIENYRCFPQLTIEFEAKLTVLVAQNGAGKSTVLDALASVMRLFVRVFYDSPTEPISDVDVRRVTLDAEVLETVLKYPVSVDIDAEIDSVLANWSITLMGTHGGGSTLSNLIAVAMRSAVANGERVVLPLIAYYGTNRLRERATSSEAANAQDFEAEFFSRTAGYKDCLDPTSSYKYFEKWFGYAAKADSDLRNQQREQMGANYVATDTAYTPLIKAVAEAVEVVLAYSGWKNLRFSFVHMNLVMTHPELGVLEISQLSDGVRSMIAMVADIAHRAVRLNAFLGREAAIKTPGLVLIDEVDLHLHPAWQQVVLESMLKAFPGIQFIVTTHSPQVISSVPDQCIRILEAGQVFHAPKGTQGAESSRILKRVFGTELRPPGNENTKLLNAYLDLVFADRWAEPEALAMRQKLDEIFSDEEPELTRADLYIETRQWELADEENP